MPRISMLNITIIYFLLLGSSCFASTFNCFGVEKQASLGFSDGAVIIIEDDAQKTCKFSINDATVDSSGSKPSNLNKLFQLNSDGGIASFQQILLSPFSEIESKELSRNFQAVFSPAAANQVGQCLANFSKGGQPQHLGLDSINCQSANANEEIRLGG
jgi:hypothetical protein